MRKHIKRDVKVRLANADDVHITIYSVIRRPDYCSPAQKKEKKTTQRACHSFIIQLKCQPLFFLLFSPLRSAGGAFGNTGRTNHAASCSTSLFRWITFEVYIVWNMYDILLWILGVHYRENVSLRSNSALRLKRNPSSDGERCCVD